MKEMPNMTEKKMERNMENNETTKIMVNSGERKVKKKISSFVGENNNRMVIL